MFLTDLKHVWCDFLGCVNLCFHLILGDNKSPWVRACLDDGSFYYFNLNKLEGCWEKPKGFIQNSVFLEQHQIQVT